MSRDGTWDLRNIEYTCFALFEKEFAQAIPDFLGAFRRRRQERLVTFVRRIVLLNEVANIDFVLPETNVESFPLRHSSAGQLLNSCCHRKPPISQFLLRLAAARMSLFEIVGMAKSIAFRTDVDHVFRIPTFLEGDPRLIFMP